MDSRPLCYLDNNATTRVAPEVIQAMLPFFHDLWGNPSSAYRFGRQVARHLDSARQHVAALLNARPNEIVFTSCGTESNNTAFHSALAIHPAKRHILTTAVEHSANIQYADYLRRQGCQISLIPVEADGSLDLHLLDQSIRPDTALVSVMWANNETGVVFPVAEIAAICRSKGVLFHTDAVQVPGKLPIDLSTVEADYLSLSGHKLHAPKGVGLLYVRSKARFHPYVLGGHQESGKRGGTENVALIAGFGRAAELAMAHLEEEGTRVRRLRDRLELGLLRQVKGVSRNGAAEPRLPNTCNLAFVGIEAEAALLALDRVGICASSGSACTTGSLKPSHVLTAMGVGPDRIQGCLRFSLSRDNTEADVDYALEHIPRVVSDLRNASPAAPTVPRKGAPRPGRRRPAVARPKPTLT